MQHNKIKPRMLDKQHNQIKILPQYSKVPLITVSVPDQTICPSQILKLGNPLQNRHFFPKPFQSKEKYLDEKLGQLGKVNFSSFLLLPSFSSILILLHCHLIM